MEDVDSQRYAEQQDEQLRFEFPEYEYTERGFEQESLLGGRDPWLRRFEWTPRDSDAGRVTQIQVYYAAYGRGYTQQRRRLCRTSRTSPSSSPTCSRGW